MSAIALVLLGSCAKKTDPSPATVAPSAAVAGSASPPSAAAERAQDPAEQVLAAWNTALDQSNANALAPLYAPRVHFYGQWKTGEEVVTAKRAALAKQPGFHQSIDGVHIKSDGGRYLAEFQKHWGPTLSSTVQATLTIEQLSGGFLITEESDSSADAQAKPRNQITCCFHGHGDSGWDCVEPSQCWTNQPAYESSQRHTCDPGLPVPCPGDQR